MPLVSHLKTQPGSLQSMCFHQGEGKSSTACLCPDCHHTFHPPFKVQLTLIPPKVHLPARLLQDAGFEPLWWPPCLLECTLLCPVHTSFLYLDFTLKATSLSHNGCCPANMHRSSKTAHPILGGSQGPKRPASVPHVQTLRNSSEISQDKTMSLHYRDTNHYHHMDFGGNTP